MDRTLDDKKIVILDLNEERIVLIMLALSPDLSCFIGRDIFSCIALDHVSNQLIPQTIIITAANDWNLSGRLCSLP